MKRTDLNDELPLDKRPPLFVVGAVMLAVIAVATYTLTKGVQNSHGDVSTVAVNRPSEQSADKSDPVITPDGSQHGVALMSVSETRSLRTMDPELRRLLMRRLVSELPVGGLHLWMKIDDGVGIVSHPLLPGRSVLTAGPYAAAVEASSCGNPANGLLLENWHWLSQNSPSPPYTPLAVWNYRDPASPGADPQLLGTELAFVPTDLPSRISITAQPLTAAGKPDGDAVPLTPYPAGPHVVYAQLPAAYSGETASIRIAAKDLNGAHGTWIVTGLPAPDHNIPRDSVIQSSVVVGPFKVSAASFEDDGHSRADQLNYDGSGADTTAFPRIDTKLTICRSDSSASHWDLISHGISPEWSVDVNQDTTNGPVADGPDETLFSTADPQTKIERTLSSPSAFPGQQHLARVSLEAVETNQIVEDVTLTGAAMHYNPALGFWTVSWAKLQTVTTPSGVVVTTLNTRGNASPASDTPPPTVWRTLKAAALFVALKAPEPMASVQQSVVQPSVKLTTVAPYSILLDEQPPSNWRAVWIPGEAPPTDFGLRRRGLGDSPIYHLEQANFSPLMLVVANGEPSATDAGSGDKPPFTFAGGVVHLRIATSQLTARIPVMLTVNVGAPPKAARQ